MQIAISNKIQLGDTLNPLKDYARVPTINDEGNLEDLIQKVDKVGEFWKTGKANGDLSRYFPNILPVTRQVQIAGELSRKAYESITYSDKTQLEFVLDLTANIYTNYGSMEICLPLKFTKKTNKAQQISDVYLSGILRSETALRQGVLLSPYQQLFEINTGTQSFKCTFKGAQRQFDWLEISVVYDKSYQHTTIYDSYDLELAAKLIQTIKFENTSTTYSITGKLFFDLEKDEGKNILYKMLVAYNCEGCSSATLTQYRNNEIYQEMTEEDEFTTNSKDDRILINMKRSKGYTDKLKTLKEATAKKLSLRVTGFSQTEYWYLL